MGGDKSSHATVCCHYLDGFVHSVDHVVAMEMFVARMQMCYHSNKYIILQGYCHDPITHVTLLSVPQCISQFWWSFCCHGYVLYTWNIINYWYQGLHHLHSFVFVLSFLREDAHQANLRSAAYEALMEMIKNSATVSIPLNYKLNLFWYLIWNKASLLCYHGCRLKVFKYVIAW